MARDERSSRRIVADRFRSTTRRFVAVVTGLLAAGAPLAGGVFSKPALAATAGVAEFPVPTAASAPNAIVTGPDGNLWFTENSGNRIGRITSSGSVSEIATPTAGSAPNAITVGSDGNLWFTEQAGNNIGRLTTAGAVTEFAIPTASASPGGISSGSDGNLWFTESGRNMIGRITPAGAITEFPANGGCYPMATATGPTDVWFLDACASLGRVSPAGVVTEYAFPFRIDFGSNNTLTLGGDGNFWFAGLDFNAGIDALFRISTTGTNLAEFPTPTAGSRPTGVTSGANGTIWATEGAGKIAESSPTGAITEFAIPTTGGTPTGITMGPDGNPWFTEKSGNKIGRLTVPARCTNLVTVPHHPAVGPAEPEAIDITLANCGTAGLSNATTSTTTTAPVGCTSAPATPSFTTSLGAGQSTVRSFPFTAPTCTGTYTVKSQTTIPAVVGTTTLATGTANYVVAVGALVDYPVAARPQAISPGSDGNLWFTEGAGNNTSPGHAVARITPSGTVTEFPTPYGHPQQITAGADGNQWFSDASFAGPPVAQIGRITPAGAINEFPVPTASNSTSGMTLGPDGNVWFTESAYQGTGQIARITPSGVVTEFGGLPTGTNPGAIVAGSDGNLWFTLGNQMGRITTAGQITVLALPAATAGYDLTLGPDGNVWFTGGDSGGDLVGRITPAGAVTSFRTPRPTSLLYGITSGGDGNLWFNEQLGARIVRVTPAGKMTEFPVNPIGNTQHLTTGPDGNIWTSEYYGYNIGQVAVGVLPSCSADAIAVTSAVLLHGSTQTITSTVGNCVSTPQLLTTTTTISPPSGCGAATTSSVSAPLLPHTKTLEASTTRPTCSGRYTVTSTVFAGNVALGSSSSSYQVI